jgi:hypothetical protein
MAVVWTGTDGSRHQLLAGARFSDDEDRRARRCGPSHQLEDLLDAPAGADDLTHSLETAPQLQILH